VSHHHLLQNVVSIVSSKPCATLRAGNQFSLLLSVSCLLFLLLSWFLSMFHVMNLSSGSSPCTWRSSNESPVGLTIWHWHKICRREHAAVNVSKRINLASMQAITTTVTYDFGIATFHSRHLKVSSEFILSSVCHTNPTDREWGVVREWGVGSAVR